MADPLEQAVAELEDAARRLREDDLDAGSAAALVERSARLAAEAAETLERRMRAEPAAAGDDQLRLESP